MTSHTLKKEPLVYVVIPVLNRIAFTLACLESLEKQTYQNFKIVVVDHGSTDNTESAINSSYPNVCIVKGNTDMWWSAATNAGIKFSLQQGARLILTLNNDLIVNEDYLACLVQVMTNHDKAVVGSVSCKYNDRTTIAFCGVEWNSWTAQYFYKRFADYESCIRSGEVLKSDLLPGRGTLIPAEIFEKIGLFDEEIFPHYAADEDFSLRAKNNGYDLLISTRACVYSHTNATGLQQKFGLFRYIIESFTSLKSPNRLKTRWKWALKHSPIPALYFFFDILRITKSMFINRTS